MSKKNQLKNIIFNLIESFSELDDEGAELIIQTILKVSPILAMPRSIIDRIPDFYSKKYYAEWKNTEGKDPYLEFSFEGWRYVTIRYKYDYDNRLYYRIYDRSTYHRGGSRETHYDTSPGLTEDEVLNEIKHVSTE